MIQTFLDNESSKIFPITTNHEFTKDDIEHWAPKLDWWVVEPIKDVNNALSHILLPFRTFFLQEVPGIFKHIMQGNCDISED